METWRCPVCRARYKGGNTCYRCRCDLSMLVTVLEQADELKRRAIRLLKEGKPNEALEAIQYSIFLRCSNESEELEALVHASQGEFDKVLRYL